MPLYITQKGASSLELGIIISLLSFTAIAAKIPLSVLAERVGRWPVIAAVIIGQAVAMLLYSFVPDVTWFYPTRIFHALVMAAFAPTAVSITFDLAPSDKRGDIMGKFLTSIAVATMLGPFLCTFLVTYVDYAQLFRLASIIPLLGLIPFLFVRRKDPSSHLTREENQGFQAFLKSIVQSGNMLVLSYLRLAFSFTNAFIITLFAVHAEKSLLLAPSLIALLFGIKGIANMFSRIPSGKFVDRIGYRWPLFLAFTILTMAYFIISEAVDMRLLAAAMILYGLAHGMRAVGEWSLLGASATSGTRSLATAYLSTIFNVGGAFGGVAAGALSIVLNVETVFKLASLIVLTASFSVMLIKTSTTAGD